MTVAKNYPKRMYNGNHSAPLGIRTRHPAHNYASTGTAHHGLSTWFAVLNRLWAHDFQTASGGPGPKRIFS